MASKTTKRANAAAKKKNQQPEVSVKDDGNLYKIVDAHGRPVYPGLGVILGEAERLAKGLQITAAVVPVE